MASCATCRGEVPAGSRWCGICHSNVLNPAVGRLASPGKRLGAYFLDFVIPVTAFWFVCATVFGIAGLGDAAGMGESAGGALAIVVSLLAFGLVIGYVVWAVRLFAHGTTPGKRALRMYVVKENGSRAGFGAMLFREWIGKWISAIPFLLGYLWILFDKDRQAWHDKLVSTYVVETHA